MFNLFSILRPTEPMFTGFSTEPIDWTPNIKWGPRLFVRAETYQPPLLFKKDKRRGRFTYENKVLPAGKLLHTWSGRRKGVVKFDGDITIPALFDAQLTSWTENPWMSITPSEVFTLRAGTKRARGHTVIAGLGLGYQLVEVMKRKQVTRVTLVEKEPDVVDLIMPKLSKLLPKKPLKIHLGDARQLVPKMKADVALIDIFPGYGYNTFVRCHEIPVVWCWGQVAV